MRLLLAMLLAGSLVAPEDSVFIQDATPLIREAWQPLARGLSISPASTPTAGNEVRFLHHAPDFRESLMQDFASAGRQIEIECFLFGTDSTGKKVADVMAQKAAEGVEVRYVHDFLGNLFGRSSNDPFFTGIISGMDKKGILKRDLSPIYNARRLIYPFYSNHRKIYIIDKEIAYAGGMNLNTHSMVAWDDSQVRLKGPSAACMHEIFKLHWNEAARLKPNEPSKLAVRGPAPSTASGAIVQTIGDGSDAPFHITQDALVWVLEHASKYVWMETPYFTPTRPLLNAMKDAAARGVDVRVLMCNASDMGIVDPVSYYYAGVCAKAGIKVMMRTGLFNHSKTFLSDDYLGCVSSANIDKLSLKRLSEILAIVYDEAAALRLKEQFLAGYDDSAEYTPQDADSRTAGQKVTETLLLPFDFLM